ncbi:MAG: molecular chaperone DnaJ [Roseburia sp.]
MNHQSALPTEDQQTAFKHWCFQETVEIERKKQDLQEEKKDLARQKKLLEKERNEFLRQKKLEDKRIELNDQKMEQERKLFEMKWKLLEDEWKKLADEKAHMERQKQFYQSVQEFERISAESETNIVKGELFFAGVRNSKSLKKRYKDLIKIYHPDNTSGDNTTLQEINREYDILKMALEE